jgi:hypothetical protein
MTLLMQLNMQVELLMILHRLQPDQNQELQEK